jgi:polyphosphate kinase
VFILESNKKATYLLGSADLMPRNLDHRIEILVPVESVRARQEVHAIMDSALADHTNAWSLDSDGSWKRVSASKSSKRHAHHAAMIRRASERARRSTRVRRVD